MTKNLSCLAIAVLCLSVIVAAKKLDKFKIKAKGYGLSHLQQAMNPQPEAEDAEEAAPAPAPAPYYYYPPAPAPSPAVAPQPAPAPAPSSYYYGNGNGAAAEASSAATAAAMSSASLTAAGGSHVLPMIMPFAVVAQPSASLPLVQQPVSAGLSAASFSHNGGYSYMPKIDLEYYSYPYGNGYYGMSAKRSYVPHYSEDDYDDYAERNSHSRWGYNTGYNRDSYYRG